MIKYLNMDWLPLELHSHIITYLLNGFDIQNYIENLNFSGVNIGNFWRLTFQLRFSIINAEAIANINWNKNDHNYYIMIMVRLNRYEAEAYNLLNSQIYENNIEFIKEYKNLSD